MTLTFAKCHTFDGAKVFTVVAFPFIVRSLVDHKPRVLGILHMDCRSIRQVALLLGTPGAKRLLFTVATPGMCRIFSFDWRSRHGLVSSRKLMSSSTTPKIEAKERRRSIKRGG